MIEILIQPNRKLIYLDLNIQLPSGEPHDSAESILAEHGFAMEDLSRGRNYTDYIYLYRVNSTKVKAWLRCANSGARLSEEHPRKNNRSIYYDLRLNLAQLTNSKCLSSIITDFSKLHAGLLQGNKS